MGGWVCVLGLPGWVGAGFALVGAAHPTSAATPLTRLAPPPTPPHPPRSALPVVTEVARSLAFSPRLHALADRVVQGVTDGGRLPFNGVHLRVEKDARDWASIMGGTQVRLPGLRGLPQLHGCLCPLGLGQHSRERAACRPGWRPPPLRRLPHLLRPARTPHNLLTPRSQVVWRGYLTTMRGLGFNATTRLYAASGMLTYGASGAPARGRAAAAAARARACHLLTPSQSP